MIRAALARVRALFRRNAIADEIRDELRLHLDLRAAEYERQGLTPQEARRRATRRFGNPAVIADRGYDIRGAGLLETIWQDVRYAARMLARQRGFAAVTMLTLAMAMGASTALFSVIDAALLRPVPYANPEQIVDMNVRVPQANGEVYSLAPSEHDLDRWRSADAVLAHLGQGRINNGRLIVDAGQPERLLVSLISPGFLEVFGVTPLLGRAVSADDTREGAAPVVWLGYGFWQRRFGGRPDVVGQTVRVEGELATIVGVLPGWFYRDCAVWRPLPQRSAIMQAMRGTGTPTYGRLLPGLDIAEAGRRLTAMVAAERGPNGPVPVEVELESLYESTTSRYRTTVRILAGAVTIVLLIACINVAGLLLARGATRQGELAVRASIGAGRGRLVRQLLTESLLLAAWSGALGLAFAWGILDLLVSVLPIGLPENAPPTINLTVLGFGLLLSLVVTLAFGLLPALRLSRVSLVPRLSRAGRRHGTPLTRRGGQMLVAAQVTLALVLLSGAGLAVRSLSRAMSVDVGFDPSSFVTMEVFPVDGKETLHASYYAPLLDAIRALPGVQAAGVTTLTPLSGGGRYSLATAGERTQYSSIRSVTPGYLEAIGLQPLQGHLPDVEDRSTNVAVLSEDAALALFPGSSAIGRQFLMRDESHTVVGVVRNVRSKTVMEFDAERPDIYLALPPASEEWFEGAFGRRPVIVVRPTGNVPGLADTLRRTAQSIGPAVIVERIRPGSDWFGDSIERTRNHTILLGLVGTLGLSLTLVGIFSVTAYAVARRTHEVGIRMTFGASPRDIVGHFVGDTAWPVVAGVAAGLACTWYASRLIESFLYDTPPREPITLTIVAAIMAVVALAAAWLPARRAGRVDPAVALRTE